MACTFPLHISQVEVTIAGNHLHLNLSNSQCLPNTFRISEKAPQVFVAYTSINANLVEYRITSIVIDQSSQSTYDHIYQMRLDKIKPTLPPKGITLKFWAMAHIFSIAHFIGVAVSASSSDTATSNSSISLSSASISCFSAATASRCLRDFSWLINLQDNMPPYGMMSWLLRWSCQVTSYDLVWRLAFDLS